MFDGRFRAPIEKAVRPVGQLLRKTGMSPDHLTILGIAFAVIASFAIGTGALRGGLVHQLVMPFLVKIRSRMPCGTPPNRIL